MVQCFHQESEKSQVAGHWPWKDLHFLLSIWILRCKSRVQGLEWAGDVRIGQLFQCYFYIFLPILENLIYLSTILFFFRTLRDWFATICRFLEYHDLYVGAHLRISHAVYRWFSCELHWDCWGVWQVELYIYIRDHSNMIQLENLHISG